MCFICEVGILLYYEKSKTVCGGFVGLITDELKRVTFTPNKTFVNFISTLENFS